MTKWKAYREPEQPKPGNYFVHRRVESNDQHLEFGVRSPRPDQNIPFGAEGITHYREMDGTSMEQAIREFHQNFWLNPLNNLYQLKMIIRSKFLSIFLN